MSPNRGRLGLASRLRRPGRLLAVRRFPAFCGRLALFAPDRPHALRRGNRRSRSSPSGAVRGLLRTARSARHPAVRLGMPNRARLCAHHVHYPSQRNCRTSSAISPRWKRRRRRGVGPLSRYGWRVLRGGWLMIGTRGATVLFVVFVLVASVLGVAAGGLTCFVLRRPWGLKAAITDAVFAPAVAVIALYVISTIEIARDVWESQGTLVLAIAAASVVLRHVARLRLCFRSN